MTAHINAKKEDISNKVLMPGDPKRAEFIAQKFLKNSKQVNDVRNMLMFTGEYEGVKVTIAASGMGCPSIGIYSYELFNFYGVTDIIRIGSAGSYTEDLNIYDLYNVDVAVGESQYAKIAANIDGYKITSSSKLFKLLNESAQNLNIPLQTGACHSSDVFYRFNKGDYKTINKNTGAKCVEMESFALFANAKLLNKNAACILTISDSLVKNEQTTSEERQNNFTDMMKVALDAIVKA
ncbi:purine-nucleoside phosphorylase [Spiroplasma endosymbiont of Amphibalanus improvisus]|uniref:purine-nucleoside phosphorylase n=1 Tax=Spiroplasma endosymbiont of Amphibalanus improvisus TaxID=3066327 RepID=UPI00313D217E